MSELSALPVVPRVPLLYLIGLWATCPQSGDAHSRTTPTARTPMPIAERPRTCFVCNMSKTPVDCALALKARHKSAERSGAGRYRLSAAVASLRACLKAARKARAASSFGLALMMISMWRIPSLIRLTASFSVLLK